MDLWKTLSKTNKTVVMYGMGNGADKILSVCNRYGIEVADFFASDGFVRGQSFHGKTVMSFSDVLTKYGKDNIIVLVSFASSLPDVMNNIIYISEVCETYVPDVPVRGDTLFCDEFEEACKTDIDRAIKLLSDERSRDVFNGVIDFRRSGKIDYLIQTADTKEDVINKLLDMSSYVSAVDVGAYDGDTARELLELCPKIKKVYAFEPDRRNYRKLLAYASTESRVKAINSAAWNSNTTLIFDDSGNRNAGLDENGSSKRHAEVEAVALDNVIDERIDYIKYDVEGAEKEALEGSVQIIKKYRPDLLISLYHRTEDLHKLILQVHDICHDYNLYLRRYPYIPAWDLNLYATIRNVK